jgi:predicted ester cyclase
MSQATMRVQAVEQLRRHLDADEYAQIRKEWITHSKAEDARDIQGLLSTLTDNCVYKLVTTGEEWHGKPGATRFYMELLSAFPDIHFDLQNIVIGPQGVFEEAHVTGRHKGQWLRTPPTGQRLEWNVVIFFPWDAEMKKFKGERVYSDLSESVLKT